MAEKRKPKKRKAITEQAKEPRKLTPKQSAFINEYFVDFNATRAAQRAGYDGSDNVLAVTGHDLLRNPKIAEVISQRLTESAMSADEVLMRLTEQARGVHARYMDEEGFVKIGELVKDGKAHLIKEVEEAKDGTKKYKFYDAQAALTTLARHHGLLVDRTEHTGKNGAPLPAVAPVVILLPDNGRNDRNTPPIGAAG